MSDYSRIAIDLFFNDGPQPWPYEIDADELDALVDAIKNSPDRRFRQRVITAYLKTGSSQPIKLNEVSDWRRR